MSAMGGAPTSVNFGFLSKYDTRLVALAARAERNFNDQPTDSLVNLRQFAELLAQHTAAHFNLPRLDRESQVDLLQRLRNARALSPEMHELFSVIRKLGNAATHELSGDHRDALHCLKLARQLAVWFHRTFGGGVAFSPGAFVPPAPPVDAAKVLREELEQLRSQLNEERLRAEAAQAKAQQNEARARSAEDERREWEELARESEAKLLEARERATSQTEVTRNEVVALAVEAAAAVTLDEADTRALIDAQLREAGWEVDSQALRYAEGARPVAGRNRAIAEWPTSDGRADYVLFVGLTAIGVVEAKRQSRNVMGALVQARRYAQAFSPRDDEKLAVGAPWGPCQVPYLFATNGRVYFKQAETESGIWFQDVRRSTNLPRALMGWPTPDGLRDELRRDVEEATRRLAAEPVTDLPGLRAYQRDAITAVEGALARGDRRALVAMATGTGKTRTFIGLIYRLVKSGRFRRILFLVDRNALGEQAATAFQTEFVDGVQTFASIFDVKGLTDLQPAPETRLHFATVQAMARRLFGDGEGGPTVHIDDYDCIVVDECHRGYTLDRELSEDELTFRGLDEYLSVYRRVLDFFDAVKIGLTATPALHTTEIFGAPVYEYTYRRAVVEGYLIDHEPPITLLTELSTEGIHFTAGDRVRTIELGPEELVTVPDELDFDVESFNRRVQTEAFNRVVCEELAAQLDPSQPGKTLIFCATEAHADLVVKLLLEAFQRRYGEVDANTVQRITGSIDHPLRRIRHFRNEALPSVAVTVDLLTTGVDIPSICNLVFLRRVRSRILYEQMLGRATRLWNTPGFTKESFRIFDAVRLYEALEPFTSMRPVVASPDITFTQLASELGTVPGEAALQLVAEQFVAKLQRKKRALEAHSGQFSALAGEDPIELAQRLSRATPAEVRVWVAAHQQLVEWLDQTTAPAQPTYIYEGDDRLVGVSQGFGPNHLPPGDYLEAFGRFLRENENRLAALKLVQQRPRELTRAELMRLRAALDLAGYPEASLQAAYRQTSNADFAASIMGYIRQRALGEPLKPYALRVSEALHRVLMSRAWTPAQKKWLKRIADAITNNQVIDRDLFNEGGFANEGGFTRINRDFDGKLEEVAGDLQDAVWQSG